MDYLFPFAEVSEEIGRERLASRVSNCSSLNRIFPSSFFVAGNENISRLVDAAASVWQFEESQVRLLTWTVCAAGYDHDALLHLLNQFRINIVFKQ